MNMKEMVRNYVLSGLVSVLVLGALVAAGVSLAAGPRESANGQGTLMVTDQNGTFRRSFSLSAQRQADGSVKGRAKLHNPQYTYGNGNQPYMLQIDISCMKVIGNVAFFGGSTTRTNEPDPIYSDAVFFSVQDNGEPGKGNDKISLAYFWDDLPPITGDPQACQNLEIGDFPLETIDFGNIQVKP